MFRQPFTRYWSNMRICISISDAIGRTITMEGLLLSNRNKKNSRWPHQTTLVSSTSRHSLMHIFLEKSNYLLQFVSVNPLEQFLPKMFDIAGWNLTLIFNMRLILIFFYFRPSSTVIVQLSWEGHKYVPNHPLKFT